MRYLYICISLILFNQNSFAEVSICSKNRLPCTYQGTVTDLNKTNLNMNLFIKITNSLDGECPVPSNANINLTVPENEEIKIGDDVKFSASYVCGPFYKFYNWE